MKKTAFPRIYLDYAASTPVDSAVFLAMQPYFSEKFGNAGSLHSFGQEAIAAVDQSRETIAKAIGAEFREVVFTGSATEANNLALRGVAGMVASDMRHETGRPRIIVSAIEHESVLETARASEQDGVEVIYLPVSRSGIVDLKKLKASLNENTLLVSVMFVNNEMGAIQPIAEISKIIHQFRESYPLSAIRYPLFHTDASQAFQFFDCNVNQLGVDLVTLSSHKIYGPKGAGCLYIRSADPSSLSAIRYPLLSGGGQEFGLRSGTENVPAIVGFAKAVELALLFRNDEMIHISSLREYFGNGVKKIYPAAEFNDDNGLPDHSPLGCRSNLVAPHIVNVYFPGHDAQDILTRLDLAGIAASSGSACRSRAITSSYVIEALGCSKERAKSSVRFSFGRPTTEGEIDATLKVLKEILK